MRQSPKFLISKCDDNRLQSASNIGEIYESKESMIKTHYDVHIFNHEVG